MTSNGIAYDNLKTFSEERRKLLRFLLEDGDVLIASKGTVQKVAVFEDQGKREGSRFIKHNSASSQRETSWFLHQILS